MSVVARDLPRGEALRIAVFASSFHPHLGGVEELVSQLARRLQGRGVPTIVVTNRWPRQLPEREVVEGTEVIRVPMRTPDSGPKSRLSYLLTTRAIESRLERLMAEEQITLIHVHCVGPNGLYAMRVSERTGIPLVVTAHGEITMDASRLYERSAFANRYLRRICGRARLVTAVSEKTASDLRQRIGHRPAGLRVIHTGADVSEFSTATPRPRDRRYISAAGRLVPQKGFDVLIRSYALARLPELDLLIAGEGPERQRLAGLVAELGLVGRVQLLGRLSHHEIAELHAGADFFVLSSVAEEGFPLVCVEALASGLPLVATRSGGVEELVEDGVQGLLVDMGDPQGLSHALRRLGTDGALRAEMAVEARERAEQFDWDVITRQYLELYREVVAS